MIRFGRKPQENPENGAVGSLETIDYTMKVISQKGSERLIQGTYDKNGLPDDWAEFMESVFEFMSFYGWGEMMNPSVYGKARRCDNDILYCSVKFEDGQEKCNKSELTEVMKCLKN